MGVYTGFKGADEQRIFRSSRTFEQETPLGSACVERDQCHFFVFNPCLTWLVGGIPTPLKNMSSSNGMMTFPIYGKIKHIPNHQSDWVDLNFETSHVRFITLFLRKLKPKKPGPQSEPIKMIRRRATHGKPTTKQETGTIYQREALHLSAVLWERVYHWSCCCRGTFWTLNLAQRIETQYRKTTTTTTTTKTEKSSGTMSLFYLFGLHIYFLARYNGFPLKHCQCVNGETVPSNHGKCWPAGPSKFAHSFPCFCTSFICRTS